MDSAAFIKKIHDIPTIATVAQQINLATQQKSLNAKSLGKIILQDPPLTAKVLKLSNSAYYGLSRQVDTVEKAVTILGFNTVKSLALTVSVFAFFDSTDRDLFDLKDLWLHSMGCAVAAKTLIHQTEKSLEEQAFICGILHDIGKIAIAHIAPDELREILGKVRDTKARQSDVEQEVLGLTHQKIGALLAKRWNFPEEYRLVIKSHHGPFTAKLDQDHTIALLCRAVFIGNKIAKTLALGKSTDPEVGKIPNDFFTFLGITKENLPALLDRIKEDFAKIVEAWDLDGGH